MEKEPTALDIGIIATVDAAQLKLLKEKRGFLCREAYPDCWEKLSLKNEVGRFLFFRFLKST
jgi:hypothetical protein